MLASSTSRTDTEGIAHITVAHVHSRSLSRTHTHCTCTSPHPSLSSSLPSSHPAEHPLTSALLPVSLCSIDHFASQVRAMSYSVNTHSSVQAAAEQKVF